MAAGQNLWGVMRGSLAALRRARERRRVETGPDPLTGARRTSILGELWNGVLDNLIVLLQVIIGAGIAFAVIWFLLWLGFFGWIALSR